MPGVCGMAMVPWSSRVASGVVLPGWMDNVNGGEFTYGGRRADAYVILAMRWSRMGARGSYWRSVSLRETVRPSFL